MLANGATVGVTASSTDVNGPAVTYSLIGDTSGGGFTINAATGVVTVADSSKILRRRSQLQHHRRFQRRHAAQPAVVCDQCRHQPRAGDRLQRQRRYRGGFDRRKHHGCHHRPRHRPGRRPLAGDLFDRRRRRRREVHHRFERRRRGNLSFITAPDFENPTDTATSGNNTYIVTVQASDGVSTDTQTITVTVTDANDAPVITSNGGGATASINVNENTTAVTTVTATDQDVPAQTLTYSLAGGADQAKFTIDAAGHLSFIGAPNFEAPTDAGTDNGYDVIVRVTDNGAPNLHTDQAITVHVQDVNESPDTNAITVTGNEDAASIAITVTGSDPDAGDSVASFHITNVPNTGIQGTLYSDAGLTTVVTEGTDVAASGNAATLYFVPNANFNTHAGAVTFNAAATDTHAVTDATPATETINVTAVNDAPVNNGVPANFVVDIRLQPRHHRPVDFRYRRQRDCHPDRHHHDPDVGGRLGQRRAVGGGASHHRQRHRRGDADRLDRPDQRLARGHRGLYGGRRRRQRHHHHAAR